MWRLAEAQATSELVVAPPHLQHTVGWSTDMDQLSHLSHHLQSQGASHGVRVTEKQFISI